MSSQDVVPNEQLRRARNLKGWSQAELAEQVGTSFEMVSRWERGLSVPSPYYRKRLCTVLGKTAEELGLVRGLGDPYTPLPSPLVFLASSHADAEKALVSHLKTTLQRQEITLWSSRQLGRHTGEHPRTALHEVVRAAQAILVIISPEARTSRHVREALEMARMYRRPVYGVWIEGEHWQECLPQGSAEVFVRIDARRRNDPTLFEEIATLLEQGSLATSTPVVSVPADLERRGLVSEPRNPYKGLQAFRSEDRDDFFGRETLIDELMATLETCLSSERGSPQNTRLLAVVGPSGSGKSSVVLAGLLPRLQAGGLPDSQTWIYLDPIVPGEHPLKSLALALAAPLPSRSLQALREDLESDSVRGLHLLVTSLTERRETNVVLFVDQFEEVFSQTATEEERQHFLDLLVTAVTEPLGPLILILTLRADFLERAMHYPELYPLLETHQRVVLPMKVGDLRATIEQPAALPDVQLTFEGNLVGDLLFEVQGQIGALPLLQFTLDQLFERRKNRMLTLQAYSEIGGVKGALANQAESVYMALPSEEHRWLARALFVRLIDPGVTEQDTTRRRAALAELSLSTSRETEMVQQVATAFLAARLLTTDERAGTPTIEVSHEALIREWTRLSDWLRMSREDIHLQQRISEDAIDWVRQGKPADRLYRGAQLTEAQKWMERNVPSQNELAFLQAAATERQQQEAMEQNRQVREMTLKRQGVNRLRSLVAVLSILLVVTAVSLQLTVQLHIQDEKDKQNALTQLQLARARILTVDAGYALSQNQLDRALLLDVKATQIAPGYETRSSLLHALQLNPQLSVVLSTKASSFFFADNLTFSSNSRMLIAADGSNVYMWDTQTREYRTLPLAQQLYSIKTPGLYSAILSSDEQTLVTAGSAGVWLWDMRTGTQLARLSAQPDTASSASLPPQKRLALSPDGTLVAYNICVQVDPSSNCTTTQIFLWNIISRQAIGAPLTIHAGVNSLAFSSDNKILASGGDHGVQLWNVATGQPIGSMLSANARVVTLAFSPDGKILASAGDDTTVKLWDVASGHLIGTLSGHSGLVNTVAFSPDGKTLASGSQDQTIRLWNVAQREAEGGSPLKSDGAVQLIAFSPDGKTLASTSTRGTIILWHMGKDSPISHTWGSTSVLQSVLYTPDGKTLLTGTQDGTILLQDVKTMTLLATLDTTGYPVNKEHGADPSGESLQAIQSLALSADGQLVASGRLDGTIVLWNVKAEKPLTSFTYPGLLRKLSLSANGQILAAGGDGGTITLWNVAKRMRMRTISSSPTRSSGSVALSPDGKLLAVDGCVKEASTDTCDSMSVWLRDVATNNFIDRLAFSGNGAIKDVAFSPDGHILASSNGSGDIRLWDVATRKQIDQIFSATAATLVFSPDGRLLLSYNSTNGTPIFSLWELAQHAPFVHTIQTAGTSSMAFSPNGQQIASVSPSGGITLWDISTSSWQARACSIANRNLSEPEWKLTMGDDAYSKVCPQFPVHWSVNDELLRQAHAYAQESDSHDAASAYRQAAAAALQSPDADFSYDVCSLGSLDRFAQIVLPACGYAVSLVPSDGRYRDARGQARVLTGDTRGAIDDFQYFVKWATDLYVNATNVDGQIQAFYKKKVSERTDWIHMLKAGKNPLSTKTLKALWNG